LRGKEAFCDFKVFMNKNYGYTSILVHIDFWRIWNRFNFQKFINLIQWDPLVWNQRRIPVWNGSKMIWRWKWIISSWSLEMYWKCSKGLWIYFIVFERWESSLLIIQSNNCFIKVHWKKICMPTWKVTKSHNLKYYENVLRMTFLIYYHEITKMERKFKIQFCFKNFQISIEKIM
jgi:hypothetical protein